MRPIVQRVLVDRSSRLVERPLAIARPSRDFGSQGVHLRIVVSFEKRKTAPRFAHPPERVRSRTTKGRGRKIAFFDRLDGRPLSRP
jgi:hypothetical protein